MADTCREEPCYSQRLLLPFVQLLASYPGFPVNALDKLRDADPDARVPISHAHALLELAVKATRDPDLGLKAGRTLYIGDTGALDYAIKSAATVREAIDCAARYMRLVNDAVEVRLELEGELAVLRLDCQVDVPRAAEDFILSTFYTQHSPAALRDAPGFTLWFMHPEPADTSEHARTFGVTPLRFSASCCGCAFERRDLDTPLKTADRNLHAVIRKHADLILADLPRGQGISARVRELLAKQLASGQPNVADIARALELSARTLGRRLEGEGTSFTALLDEVRHKLALRYLGGSKLGLSEVAFLLGFAHGPAFHRAFKRWTGQTPLEYRRNRNG